jgi:5-methylcytosine-specific restriction endonuclease McrA
MLRRTPLRRRAPLRARRAGRPARPSGFARPQRAAFVCRHCGATFHRARRRGRDARFCSRRCARLHREERVLAAASAAPEHSPAWWKRLRAYVRARDHFRCVLCGAHEIELGCELHVDHIYPRRAYREAIDVYRRFGTAGFVSVCPRCHGRKTSGAEA